MGAKGKTKVTLPVSKADDLSVRLDMPQADFAMLVQMAHRFLAVCDESGEFEGTGPTHPAWERWRVERFIKELDHGETMLENSKAAMKILRHERRKLNLNRARLQKENHELAMALAEKKEYIFKFHKLSGLTETDVNNA